MKGVLIAMASIVILASCGQPDTSRQRTQGNNRGISQAELADWDRRIKHARKRPAYVVDRDHWIRFPVPPNTRRVRLLTNASLSKETPLEEITDIRYAFEIQILSLSKSVIQTKVHNLRSRVPLFVDATSSAPSTANFYHPRERLIPAGGKALHLDLGDVDGASSIRLRLVMTDPSVQDAVIRVSSQNVTARRQLRYAWNRLGEDQQDELAEATLFGSTRLLSKEERTALVSQPWVPIGPVGIEDRDYDLRELYSARRDDSRKEYDPSAAFTGLIVSPQRRITVPVPEEGADWVFVAAMTESAVPAATLQMTYHDSTSSEKRTRVITITGDEMKIPESLPARGLIEIAITGATAEIKVIEGERDVSPKALLVRSAAIAQTGELRYKIFPQGAARSSYRLDLRGMLVPHQHLAAPTIDYILINTDGAELESGSLGIDPTPSLFAGLPHLPSQSSLTTVTSYYLQPGEEVSALILKGTAPILANLYTRPGGRRLTQRIPQDYVKTTEARKGKQRQWFPIQHTKADGSDVQIALQPEPPEIALSPDEDYQWTDFVPEGAWRGMDIFTPRSPSSPVREEAYLSVYTPVATNQRVATSWLTPHTLRTVQPKLLYLSPSPLTTPVWAQIQLGKDVVTSYPLTASSGEIVLPEVHSGPGQLEITLPKEFKAFVNYHQNNEGSLLKRQVIRIDPEQCLTFAYAKQSIGEETLTGRFYTQTGTTEPTTLLVDLEPAFASSALALREHATLTQRRLIISPSTSSVTVPALNAGGKTFNEGQRFLLPIGSDIAATTMPLKITHISGPRGYLQLNRIVAGLGRSIYVYKEDTE